MDVCVIYKLTNKINGKIYVGRTVNLRWRKSKHKRTVTNTLVSRAINKYGWENFVLEILEHCDPVDIIQREQYYLDTLKPFDPIGYNILETADENPMEGRKHSIETRKKMSEKKRALYDNGYVNHFAGKKHTQEAKDKIRQKAILRHRENKTMAQTLHS